MELAKILDWGEITSDYDMSRETMLEEARSNGFNVIECEDEKTILMDLDDVQFTNHDEIFDTLTEKVYEEFEGLDLSVTVKDVWASKSGNTHAVLELDREASWPVRSQVALLLGSDPAREKLAMVRYLEHEIAEPWALFKPSTEEEE